MLDIRLLKEKLLRSFNTSGDPVTGIPAIVTTDVNKRELQVAVETKEWKTERLLVRY